MAIEITDVTLRDGLQMEARILSTEQKHELFTSLAACGYDRLEVTSFVHPKWLPQFADAESLAARLPTGGTPLMAFVPNEKGLERCLRFPIPWVSLFVAASETFNRKNVNTGVDETLAEAGRCVARARREGRRSRIYVSTVFGCPYEGEIPDTTLFPTLEKVVALGPDEIALSDTIGVAVPARVREILGRFRSLYPAAGTALHLHDTYGMAVASALAGAEAGITRFDGATGGVGGCPYAKGATGNVATEDLQYAFFRAGSGSGPPAEVAAALRCLTRLGIPPRSRLAEIWAKGGTPYGLAHGLANDWSSR